MKCSGSQRLHHDQIGNSGSTVAGFHSNTHGFVRWQLKPDIVLLDIDLGPESGFDVAAQLTSDGDAPVPTVILISTHAEHDFTDLIADSPAAGFVSKADLSAAAIRGVLSRRR